MGLRMSFRRHSDKPDAVTQQIVDELRALHFSVEHIGRPWDLLVRRATWPVAKGAGIGVGRPANKQGDPELDKPREAPAGLGEEYGGPDATRPGPALVQ